VVSIFTRIASFDNPSKDSNEPFASVGTKRILLSGRREKSQTDAGLAAKCSHRVYPTL
jgi:hypothetical protein